MRRISKLDKVIGGTAFLFLLAGGACLDTTSPKAFNYICAVIIVCAVILGGLAYKYNLCGPYADDDFDDDEEYEEYEEAENNDH